MGLHTVSHLLLSYNRNTPAAYAIERQLEQSEIQRAVMDIARFRIPSAGLSQGPVTQDAHSCGNRRSKP